jgi:hypothetical protein
VWGKERGALVRTSRLPYELVIDAVSGGCGSAMHTGCVVGRDRNEIEQGSLAMGEYIRECRPDEIPEMTESGSSGRIVPRFINNIEWYSKIFHRTASA